VELLLSVMLEPEEVPPLLVVMDTELEEGELLRTVLVLDAALLLVETAELEGVLVEALLLPVVMAGIDDELETVLELKRPALLAVTVELAEGLLLRLRLELASDIELLADMPNEVGNMLLDDMLEVAGMTLLEIDARVEVLLDRLAVRLLLLPLRLRLVDELARELTALLEVVDITTIELLIVADAMAAGVVVAASQDPNIGSQFPCAQ